MGMNVLGWIHTGFATAAIIAGLLVLLEEKGTAAHRRLGWAYVGCMAVMLVTSFGIYRLTGRWGIFHVFSLWAVVTLLMGVLPAYRKSQSSWLDRHYFWMTYSYVGLLAAAASEALTRFRLLPFGIAVAVATAVVLALGAAVIHTRGLATLRSIRARWIP